MTGSLEFWGANLGLVIPMFKKPISEANSLWRKGYGCSQESLEHAERGNQHFMKGKSGALFEKFCAFCKNFFHKIFDSKTLLWPPGVVLVVLQYSEECSSAFLTQKNFEKQYCVGPTYTKFSRNRASVRRFSSNFFLEALEAFLKNFNFQRTSGYG